MARNDGTTTAPKASADPRIRFAVLTVAAAFLFAGCVGTPGRDSSATLQELEGDEPVGEPIEAAVEPGRTVFTWIGDLEGDACLYASGQGCSIAFAGTLDDKPENHQKWYEVTLDESPRGAELELSWSVESGSEPHLRFVLSCQEPGPEPCRGNDSTVAETDGTEPPLRLEIENLSWFGGSDRMWIFVGVVPETTPAGDYYPAVDIEFEANADFNHV